MIESANCRRTDEAHVLRRDALY